MAEAAEARPRSNARWSAGSKLKSCAPPVTEMSTSGRLSFQFSSMNEDSRLADVLSASEMYCDVVLVVGK